MGFFGSSSKKPPQGSLSNFTYAQRFHRLFFYHKQPTLIPTIGKILEKCKGQEAQCMKAFVGKFGAEPSLAQLSAEETPADDDLRQLFEQSKTPLLASELPPPALGADWKLRFERMMAKYDRKQLGKLDDFLAVAAGREESVMSALVKKYGAEPLPDEVLDVSAAMGKSQQGQQTRPWRDRFIAMFEKYDKSQIKKIDAMMEMSKGQEEKVLKSLVARYGPEPTFAGDQLQPLLLPSSEFTAKLAQDHSAAPPPPPPLTDLSSAGSFATESIASFARGSNENPQNSANVEAKAASAAPQPQEIGYVSQAPLPAAPPLPVASLATVQQGSRLDTVAIEASPPKLKKSRRNSVGSDDSLFGASANTVTVPVPTPAPKPMALLYPGKFGSSPSALAANSDQPTVVPGSETHHAGTANNKGVHSGHSDRYSPPSWADVQLDSLAVDDVVSTADEWSEGWESMAQQRSNFFDEVAPTHHRDSRNVNSPGRRFAVQGVNGAFRGSERGDEQLYATSLLGSRRLPPPPHPDSIALVQVRLQLSEMEQRFMAVKDENAQLKGNINGLNEMVRALRSLLEQRMGGQVSSSTNASLFPRDDFVPPLADGCSPHSFQSFISRRTRMTPAVDSPHSPVGFLASFDESCYSSSPSPRQRQGSPPPAIGSQRRVSHEDSNEVAQFCVSEPRGSGRRRNVSFVDASEADLSKATPQVARSILLPSPMKNPLQTDLSFRHGEGGREALARLVSKYGTGSQSERQGGPHGVRPKSVASSLSFLSEDVEEPSYFLTK